MLLYLNDHLRTVPPPNQYQEIVFWNVFMPPRHLLIPTSPPHAQGISVFFLPDFCNTSENCFTCFCHRRLDWATLANRRRRSRWCRRRVFDNRTRKQQGEYNADARSSCVRCIITRFAIHLSSSHRRQPSSSTRRHGRSRRALERRVVASWCWRLDNRAMSPGWQD
jgi:hypothetical protein